MVQTPDGQLVIFGGSNGVEMFNTVWVFDPDTLQWIQQYTSGYRPPFLYGHTAAVVSGYMFVYGGFGHPSMTLGPGNGNAPSAVTPFSASSALKMSMFLLFDLPIAVDGEQKADDESAVS